MNASPDAVRANALHAQILDVHAALRRSERDLALLLAELADSRLFLVLGYASLRDYGEQVLDLRPRKTAGLAALGRRLHELPALEQALVAGELGWTKARELLGVVTPDNEAAWVEQARETTSRELERMVAAHAPGERPTQDRLKDPPRRRVCFEVDASDADLLQAALAALRATAGVSREEVSDGTLLAQMAQRVIHDLEQEEAPTGERYRTVLEHCPRRGLTTGVDAEVTDTHVGSASCGGEVMEMRPGPNRGHIARLVPPATRRAVLHRDGYRCAVPGCSNRLWLDVHHLRERQHGGGHEEGNLLTLCCTHHRLVHDGLMAVEPLGEALEFRFLDGRSTRVRFTPRATRTPPQAP